MKVKLENSFHQTKTSVVVPDSWGEWEQHEIFGEIEYRAFVEQDDRYYGPWRRRLARVQKTLCGVSGCSCGVVR